MSEQRLLGGRYEVGEVLGRGGMATVRRARDLRLSRDVAVKELRIDLASDPTFQARFRREAQAAAGLNHPTIVAVYDTGEEKDEASGVGVPYIVMELIQGRTLRDLLRDGRPILPRRALEFTDGVLDALAYSHRAGIVHRDIKPANVMITPAGLIKVMDFGIARAVADTSSTMTQTAAVIGTAQYLSPEQARGETVDARSDIYSAGCLMYELLVGRPPFTGDSPVSVAYQHVREAPVPPSQRDAEITPAMDAVVLKALAKSPQDRYQSASEMSDDVRRLLDGQPVQATIPPVPVPVPLPDAAPASAPTAVYAPEAALQQTAVTSALSPVPDRQPARRRRMGWLWPLVTGVLLLAVVAGSAYLLLPKKTQVTVPGVVGLEQSAAELLIHDKNLQPQASQVQGPDDSTVGRVTDQNPQSGAQVDPGATIIIVVNIGPTKLTLPSGIVGNDVNLVKASLNKAGFSNVNPVKADTEPPDAKANQVLRVDPTEGSRVAAGQLITLYYATGQARVPAIGNYGKDTALKYLGDLGFHNVAEVGQPSPVTAGSVTNTDPAMGTLMNKTDKLTVYYATPMPTATTTTTTTVTTQPTPSKSATPGPTTTSSP